MTPKEKAQELVDRFREFADGTDPETDRYSPNIEKQKANKCALIALDEILKYSRAYGFIGMTEECNQMKKEIEKL